MSDEILKELESQIRTLGNRRDELKSKQVAVEIKYQGQLDAMAAALLEESSTKVFDAFKRDIAGLEVERAALSAALQQLENKITSISDDIRARKRILAEAEVISIAERVKPRISDTIALVYALAADIALLRQDYRRAKELAFPLGITTAELLEPEQFEALETVKWLMAFELPHRLTVLKRNHPALAREDLEVDDLE
jgi:hypothetical protein